MKYLLRNAAVTLFSSVLFISSCSRSSYPNDYTSQELLSQSTPLSTSAIPQLSMSVCSYAVEIDSVQVLRASPATTSPGHYLSQPKPHSHNISTSPIDKASRTAFVVTAPSSRAIFNSSFEKEEDKSKPKISWYLGCSVALLLYILGTALVFIKGGNSAYLFLAIIILYAAFGIALYSIIKL